MGGQYNSQFAQFFGTNCLGYKNRTEVDQKVSGAVNITIEGQVKDWAK